MNWVVSSIVEVFMNIIALRISVCADDCTAELAIIASNEDKQQECIPVGCVPSTAVAVSAPGGWGVSAQGRVGLLPEGCLLWGKGVPALGECLLLEGGCLVPGGAWSWGVPAPGGRCLLQGSACSREGMVSQHALRQPPPCEQNDRQV